MSDFIHALSDVQSSHIGKNTKLWQFSVVLPGAMIGDDCNICAHTFIENQVTIGDRVIVESGVFLWDNTHIEDDVFIGPNATFTNDKYPRFKHHSAQYVKTKILMDASIGANAKILPVLTIGRYVMVGAGAVVTLNEPDHAIVQGNPARVVGSTNED